MMISTSSLKPTACPRCLHKLLRDPHLPAHTKNSAMALLEGYRRYPVDGIKAIARCCGKGSLSEPEDGPGASHAVSEFQYGTRGG